MDRCLFSVLARESHNVVPQGLLTDDDRINLPWHIDRHCFG